jgi:hypothetical protein
VEEDVVDRDEPFSKLSMVLTVVWVLPLNILIAFELPPNSSMFSARAGSGEGCDRAFWAWNIFTSA